MRYRQYLQIIGLTILLISAADAQSGSIQSDPSILGAAASTSVRAASAEDARIVTSSALGTCFSRPPQYPAAALRDDQQGKTIVSFEVSTAGVAERPAVLRSSQFALLDEAALNHLKKCLKTTANETDGTLPPGLYALPLIWQLE
jgi:TonB family protein